MIWKRFFGTESRDEVPYQLYGAAVRQARSPAFYLDGGVPDTVEGRFEMVALHAWLLLRRLREGGEAGKATGQKVFDILFDDMDQTLREMGVGDLSVGKKIKALAASFYGRMQAYDGGLQASGDELLAGALLRNVYGEGADSGGQAERLAAYVRRADRDLHDQAIAEMLAGRVVFGTPFQRAETVPDTI